MLLTPDVSVVMSVYNGASSLEATLCSVMGQQGCNFEFVVVNDGSTDQTRETLDSWAMRDNRLRVIHQSNTGLTRALIAGCAAASGEFIARQDAGDISLPGRLSRQWRVMSQNLELSFVSAYTRMEGPDGEFLFQQCGSGAALQPTSLIDLSTVHGVVDGPSHHGSVMFRRDQYLNAGGYRAAFRFGQDWDLWYRLAERGKFLMLDEVLYQARIGLTDISISNKVAQERLARLARRCVELRFSKQDESTVLAEASKVVQPARGHRDATARGAYFVGECLRRNGQRARARHYFNIAIRNCPRHAKAWLRLAQTVWI